MAGVAVTDRGRSARRGSDSVFHAPQNLEKGGHGVSPCTMHHLKSLFRAGEAFCFAHSFSIVESAGKISVCDDETIIN